MTKQLLNWYRALHKRFGPQHWWPGDTAFEVMVGAVLTQNTNWQNVEKAIRNLKAHRVFTPQKLYRLPQKKLAGLIRSAGYYNIKAKRLKEFLKFFVARHGASTKRLSARQMPQLRRELLALNGIGPETADSILLYALNKPAFVVDAYTKRIASRHGLVKEDADYETVQSLFMRNLKHDVRLFNEYHALLVRLGKDCCHKRRPRCETCPLKKV